MATIEKGKHTAGPWNYQSAGGWISGPNEMESIAKIVFKCDEYASESERAHDHANARLIAAAPELLEALKATLASLEAVQADEEGVGQMPWIEIQQAHAAIAKAEGRE